MSKRTWLTLVAACVLVAGCSTQGDSAGSTTNGAESTSTESTPSPSTSAPNSIQPSDADSCAATFYPAVDSDLIRQPREDEGFMVSFQDSDQWDGGYPVCWAVYQSDATGCEFFALHMNGSDSEAVWAESGTEDPPCEINVTSDPTSYREFTKP